MTKRRTMTASPTVPGPTRAAAPRTAIMRAASDTPPARPRPDWRRDRPHVYNRVNVYLAHVPMLTIRGQARLAEAAGVSRSTVSRLVCGRINPSYRLARAVTDALSRLMGDPLEIKEVFTTDGTYPTPSGCARCGCRGCLPSAAWGDDGTLKPEWRDARPGDWSVARLLAPDPAAAGKEVR